MEDIIEEIVGDIDDELDVLNFQECKWNQINVKNNFLVHGTVNIRDLNKQIDTNIPVGNASTVAGLIL